jgi:ribosomal protein S18 acetylase RimI-like enzyme
MSKFDNIFLEYRKKLKEEVIYISDGKMEDLSDEYDEEDLFDQIDELERNTPIPTIKGKDIMAIYLDTGEVIGALYTKMSLEDVDDDEQIDFTSDPVEIYTFDIIVHPDQQGKRIGTKLLDIAIEDFNEKKDGNDKMVVKLDVIDARMKTALEKRGFEVKKEKGTDRWIMGTIDEQEQDQVTQ